MSFTCVFYNYSGPPNKIKKVLENSVGSKACSPYQAVSELHGFIILDYSTDLEAANYVKVYQMEGEAEINVRYCYIEDWIKNTGGQLQLRLELDPLMTFQTEILNTDAYVFRTSQNAYTAGDPGYNMDIADSKRPLVAYHLLTVEGNVEKFGFDNTTLNPTHIFAQIIAGGD